MGGIPWRLSLNCDIRGAGIGIVCPEFETSQWTMAYMTVIISNLAEANLE